MATRWHNFDKIKAKILILCFSGPVSSENDALGCLEYFCL